MEPAIKGYFVDGYHGGIKGHMPLGAWADVIRQLESRPDWKISLDIEPISWDALRRTDPSSYAKLKRLLLNEAGSRVEMVAGSFAQPFGWVIGGESNIRHLLRGREILQEHFPGLTVDTYATQEPCWTSSLPQILRSLGYRRAVLKNPGTAWGGYAAGLDAETVLWTGPDGTSIPCVPRYACEELLQCWETEAGYMEPAFVDKCVGRGIAHPVGSFLQDLGWPARPKLDDERIRYVTWREYFEEIAERPTRVWQVAQEDFQGALPWGEATLQRMAREVRAAENNLVQTEKLAALASALKGVPYPAEKLRQAWDQLLLAQHHDAWICATTREGREKWAWQAGAETWETERLCADIRDGAADGWRREPAEQGAGDGVVVWNTLGNARKELIEVEVPAPEGTKAMIVRDRNGNPVPSQLAPTRVYPSDGSVNAGKLIFEAEAPAMGFAVYTVEPAAVESAASEAAADAQAARARATVGDGFVAVETDLYAIRIDTARGGVIAELFDKQRNKSVVREREGEVSFNEYAGYAIEKGRWASSKERPVAATLKENGPLRVVLEMEGSFAGVPFTTTLTAAAGRRTLDFRVRFRFEEETWIGDPWEMEPEHRSTERRKSHHNGRFKLQAKFSVPLRHRQVYKNAAFDVAKSRHADTHFERWDEIKHNILLNWVDVYDEERDEGLAIFSDHTTAYGHSEEDHLSLVLGWGGEAGFWWGKRPLKGIQEARYAVLPHGGRWDRAGVQQESSRWNEPLAPLFGQWAGAEATLSLLGVTDPAVEIASLRRDGTDSLVRLFNSAPEARSFELIADGELSRASAVELDGRPIGDLPLTRGDRERRWRAALTLRPFGLATIRLHGLSGRNDSEP